MIRNVDDLSSTEFIKHSKDSCPETVTVSVITQDISAGLYPVLDKVAYVPVSYGTICLDKVAYTHFLSCRGVGVGRRPIENHGIVSMRKTQSITKAKSQNSWCQIPRIIHPKTDGETRD